MINPINYHVIKLKFPSESESEPESESKSFIISSIKKTNKQTNITTVIPSDEIQSNFTNRNPQPPCKEGYEEKLTRKGKKCCYKSKTKRKNSTPSVPLESNRMGQPRKAPPNNNELYNVIGNYHNIKFLSNIDILKDINTLVSFNLIDEQLKGTESEGIFGNQSYLQSLDIVFERGEIGVFLVVDRKLIESVDEEGTKFMFSNNIKDNKYLLRFPTYGNRYLGWSEQVDPNTGNTFYYNAAKNKKSQTLPEGIEDMYKNVDNFHENNPRVKEEFTDDDAVIPGENKGECYMINPINYHVIKLKFPSESESFIKSSIKKTKKKTNITTVIPSDEIQSNCTNRNPQPPCKEGYEEKLTRKGNKCCYKSKTKTKRKNSTPSVPLELISELASKAQAAYATKKVSELMKNKETNKF